AAMPPDEATAWLLARGEHGWRRPADLAPPTDLDHPSGQVVPRA
ncbi:EAL domain-containing protein, partial [Streptomyces sp. SID2131]|nr:EAL domain-containing protein [Streptomyces sp. SID2131]